MSDGQNSLYAALEKALAGGVSEAFEEAEARAGSIYDLPPDGEYQALIHLFEFMEYKDNKGIGLKVSYQITNDRVYAGRIAGDLFTIASFKPDGTVDTSRIDWLKGWLALMGVDVAQFDIASELRPSSPTLEALLDTPVLIKIKRTQGKWPDGSPRTFENIYLVKPLGEWGSGASTADFAPRPASDVTSQASLDGFSPPPAVARAADDDIPF